MKRPCILILIACLLGELLGYYLSAELLGIGLILIPATVFLIKKYTKVKINKKYILAFFTILIIFIIRMKFQIYSMNTYMESHIEKGTEVCLEVKSIAFKGDNVVFTSEGMIIYLKKEKYEDDIKIGNMVSFQGNIEEIGEPRNPGEFDAKLYYSIKGIYFRMSAKSYSIVKSEYNYISQLFFITREYLSRNIDNIFSEENAGIIKAVLLGVRQDLDREVYKMYQKNGIAHLLAISGLHVSILGIGLYKFLRKIFCLKFHTCAIISSFVLGAYGMLVGEGVSVIRASSMLIIYFIADVYGRSYCLISALCISAAGICLISPFELFGVGFQLSFGAVLSLGGPIAFILKKFKKSGKVFDTVAVSMGVQILTLPIILYYFYTFPVYAFILNIIVIPLMGIVLCSSILSTFLYIINLFLYKYVSMLSEGVLGLYAFLCNIIKFLPHYSMALGRPGIIKIFVYYIYVFLIIILAVNKKRKRILALTLPAIFILFPFFKSDKAVFLDVGQGDGIYMHIRGTDILIDGGSTSNKTLGEYSLEPFLLYEGVEDIEMSFITHSDIDHISGVLYLLESDIKIKNLYLPYQAMEDSSYDELKEKAMAAGSHIEYLSMGDSFENKYFKINCLWPDREPKTEVNEESQVFVMEVKGKRLLFTGDIGKVSEESIIRHYNIGKVDILKVAHHGSKNSSLKEFIENVSPTYAVISYGKNNNYGHPGKETIETLNENGSVIFETAKMGAIEVKLE